MAGRFRIIVLVGALALALGACGWTQYAGNAGRTGANPVATGLTTTNAQSLAPEWSTAAPGSNIRLGPSFAYAVDNEDRVAAYSLAETAGCPAVPVHPCAPRWRSSVVGTTVDIGLDDETLFVVGQIDGHWTLIAFDADGERSCTSTTDRVCNPMWRADLGPVGGPLPGRLALDAGRVSVPAPGIAPGAVAVFDARGVIGCDDGTQRCLPMFRLQSTEPVFRPIAVASGRAFVPTSTGFEVFDATGTTCAAAICAPIATLDAGAAFGIGVVDGESLFTESESELLAFDITPEHLGSCPKQNGVRTCSTRWRAATPDAFYGRPVVAAGAVFVGGRSDSVPPAPVVRAFDESGRTRCSATQHTCRPLWTSAEGALWGVPLLAASGNLLFAASSSGGITSPSISSLLTVFDVRGAAGCSGSTRICQPVASIELVGGPFGAVGDLALGPDFVAVQGSGLIGTTIFGLP